MTVVIKTTTDDANDFIRLTLTGSLSSTEMREIETQVHQIIDSTHESILIDLGELQYMDSTGISLLIGTSKRLRELGREMILVNLQSNIEKMFHASNLIRIFKVAQSEQEALALLRPRTVLLFDEREDIVYFYKEVIEANHFRCRNTGDLEEALSLLRDGQVELVLIDALDSDEPKYELVRRMKGDSQLNQVPILVLFINEDEEFQYSQFGVDRFILKPFKIDRFVATLKQLLCDE
jgi:anti-sigma B factor antagonist